MLHRPAGRKFRHCLLRTQKQRRQREVPRLRRQCHRRLLRRRQRKYLDLRQVHHLRRCRLRPADYHQSLRRRKKNCLTTETIPTTKRARRKREKPSSSLKTLLPVCGMQVPPLLNTSRYAQRAVTRWRSGCLPAHPVDTLRGQSPNALANEQEKSKNEHSWKSSMSVEGQGLWNHRCDENTDDT